MGSGLLWAQVHPNQRYCQPWPAPGPGTGPGKFLGTRAASSIRGPGRYQHTGTQLSLEALGRTKHQCGNVSSCGRPRCLLLTVGPGFVFATSIF